MLVGCTFPIGLLNGLPEFTVDMFKRNLERIAFGHVFWSYKGYLRNLGNQGMICWQSDFIGRL